MIPKACSCRKECLFRLPRHWNLYIVHRVIYISEQVITDEMAKEEIPRLLQKLRQKMQKSFLKIGLFCWTISYREECPDCSIVFHTGWIIWGSLAAQQIRESRILYQKDSLNPWVRLFITLFFFYFLFESGKANDKEERASNTASLHLCDYWIPTLRTKGGGNKLQKKRAGLMIEKKKKEEKCWRLNWSLTLPSRTTVQV